MKRNKDLAEIIGGLPVRTPSGEVTAPDSRVVFGDGLKRSGVSNTKFLGEVEDTSRALNTYSVKDSEIYDTLSDGSYVSKYENYVGSTGNEDRLAKQQSGLEQWTNGISKMATKTLSYAADSVFGTLYGVGQSLMEGDFSKLYDNDLSNWFDDVNKQMDYAVPNYYTDEQKSMGFLESLGTVNFWANDVGNGLAFVGGALLPSIAMTALSGGTLAAPAFGSLVRSGGKLFLREGVKQTMRQGSQAIKQLARTKMLGTAADKAKTLAFLGRTSSFEAGMEARHNLHQANDEFINSFIEREGRVPNIEELSEFNTDAVKAANQVYSANMAILSISNTAMYGRFLGWKTPSILSSTKNSANKVLGLGVTRDNVGRLTTQTLTKGQKIGGTAFKVLKPITTEGLFEEGLQGVAGSTMQNYLKAKYDPELDPMSFSKAFSEAFNHQYSSKEGWKEIGIGGIIGILGAGIGTSNKNKAGVSFGMSNYKNAFSISHANKNLSKEVKDVNLGVDNMMNSLASANVVGSTGANQSSTEASIENDLAVKSFIESQSHLKTEKEILEDFNAIVDIQEFSEEQQKEIENKGFTASSYKTHLKETFEKQAKKLDQIKGAIKAVNLGKGLNAAQQVTLQDGIITSYFINESLENANDTLATEINNLSGIDGITSAVNLIHSLGIERTKDLTLLSKLREQKDSLEKQYLEAQTSMEQSSPEDKKKFATKLLKVRNQLQETQSKVIGLEESLTILKNTADSNLDTSETSIIKMPISEAMDVYQNLTKKIEALRSAGRKNEANKLENLVQQHVLNTAQITETRQLHNDMAAENFFTTSKGSRFRNQVLGEKFSVDSNTKEILEKNADKIIQQLENLGFNSEILDGKKVSEYISEQLTSIENVSDRNKYRIIRLLRTELMTNLVQEGIDDRIIKVADKLNPDVSSNSSDTIQFDKKIDESKMTDLEYLRELETELVDQVESIIEVSQTTQEFNERRDKIKSLKEQEQNIKGEISEEGESEDLSSELEEIQAEIEELKEVRKDTVRDQTLKKLLEKKVNEGLTEEEQELFDETLDEYDNWQLIDGVITQGYRLSDIIRQRIALEQPISKSESSEVEFLTESDSSVSNPIRNSGVGQTYGAVTSNIIEGGEKISIQGLTEEEFEILSENEVPFEYTEQGGQITISLEDAKKLSEKGIFILPAQENMSTQYSPVYEIEKQTGNLRPLGSSYINSFNEDIMEPEEVYNLEEEDEIILQFDIEDPYNQRLLDNTKDRNAQSKILQEQGVIRMFSRGKFVGVLKSGPNINGKMSKTQEAYAKFRADVLTEDAISELKTDLITPDNFDLKVKKVLVGHINFNYVATSNGLVLQRNILEKGDLSNIVDTGFIQAGEIETKNGTSPRTTFFNKKIDSKNKIPFVVIRKGNTDIAMPVYLDNTRVVSRLEYEQVLNSGILDIDKMEILNNMLVRDGLNIQEQGNAFIAIGEGNLTQSFLDEKLEQLEQIPTFDAISNFTNKKVSLDDTLVGKASVSFNTQNPVFGAKIVMNLEELTGKLSPKSRNNSSATLSQQEVVVGNFVQQTACK